MAQSNPSFEVRPSVITGDTADVYLHRTQRILRNEGLNPTVVMEFAAAADGARVDRVLLDNMARRTPDGPDVSVLEEAVRRVGDAIQTEASGNVTSVLTPRGDDTPESVSGKMPSLLDDDREVLVSADAIRYDGNAGQATYTGQAHLWQGATSFWGDTLTLDDRTGNLIARGNVRTSIQLVRLNETTQRREVSLTYAEADTFVYDEAAKHAVYETTARLRSEHVDLKADTIEVFLETDGRTLDKLQATGDVKLRLDGRWATGESLVYYEAEGRYEMEGAPVEIVEEVEPVETTTTAPPPPGAIPPPPSCSSSTGLTLTFYRSTDTVTVDGQEERRTEINSGKCTPLTF